MYDREFVKLTITSPFPSFINNEIAMQELVDGYKYGVRSAIVAPGQVDLINEVKKEHENGYSRTGMVIGYPYGGMSTKYKVYLAKLAMEKQIDEVDVGVNMTAAMSGDFDKVRDELKQMLDAVEGKVKLIPMLWMVKVPFEIVDKLCEIYIELGITSIKTSAGIHFGFMTVEHITYLHKKYGDKIEIEVAGKVRTRELAENMHREGAKYFHMGSWRSVSGIGTDVQYNPATKEVFYIN